MTRGLPYAVVATIGFACCACDPSPASAATEPAPAPPESAPPTRSAPSEPVTDFQAGDYIHLQHKKTFWKMEDDDTAADSGKSATRVCFKPHTALKFTGTRVAGEPNLGETILVFKREERLFPLFHRAKYNEELTKDCQGDPLPKSPGAPDNSPESDTAWYGIYKNKLQRGEYKHFGVTHGPLFVPFKRRPDKSLSGESSLGYYIGYRADLNLAFAVTPIATAGLSLVNTTNDAAITPTSTTQDSGVRPAFTYGVGLIFTNLDQFQIGAIYAWDEIGGDAGKQWKYEGKGWYSLAIGYSFTR